MKAAPLALLLLAAGGAQEADRAPADVAVTPDGRFAVTANRSGSVSVVDLKAFAVVAELPVGGRPFAVAAGRERGAVTTRNALVLLKLSPPAVETTIELGHEARGVALSESTAYVALGGEDAVVAVDLASGKVRARAAVGEEPWDLLLTPEVLAVGNTRSGTVSILDPADLKVLRTAVFPGARNLRRMAATSDWLYVPHIVDRGGTTTLRNIEQGKVIVNRLGRVSLKLGTAESLAMDVDGMASADLEDVAVAGDRLAVIAGGVRAVLLLRGNLPWKVEPGPHMDKPLSLDPARYRRNALRGRPVAAVAIPGTTELLVANDLRNQLQVVETEAGEITKVIPLGGPERPATAERRGEAIFHDGYRSWHEWFSCHTCHPDGHTNGGIYDTFNDGKDGNPKKTLSLRGSTKTPPYTWHGWQKELGASVDGSFRGTQAKGGLAPDELADVLAYLKTIDFLPPPAPADAGAVRRGEALFADRACADCHAPPLYTSKRPEIAGLEKPDDAYKGYSPPSLKGVGRRGPWMHDGRGKSLEDVLREHHRPSKLNNAKDFSPEEAADLAAFLRSL